ncbi:hypothetical protein L6452_03895 [Arctium lappa]|uniref:Uncharacterized protein n=1 Tax=Arctium lappa TaxID=4217 RepID=A0ACB9FMW9_ARCLA|nr:hypothetical protein L6452_03895 [Arctium lappa]
MEDKNQTSSSSSFTAQLFGSKDSCAAPSTGLFNSIFPPPKPHGKDYISSELTEKNHGVATKRDSVDKEDKSRNLKKDTGPFYQQERSQPCHLSSSIYYGGQDIYTNPQITNNTPGNSTKYDKDGEDDGHASRGNWWQGSLYY